MRALFPLLVAFALVVPIRAQEYFELRTYHSAEGKFEALQQRFQNHTLALFEKHGMTNLAYWVPLGNSGGQLIYLLGYASKEARETAWQAFLADPAWIEAKAASEVDGKLVAKVESVFLQRTDYSPGLPLANTDAPRSFEMRHYTTREGMLPALDARFRDHTMALFHKHGMTNLIYFHLAPGQEGADTTLLYFLAHRSDEARQASFKTFREDPEWIAVRDASEKNGKILVDQGVVSTPLAATPYSPLR